MRRNSSLVNFTYYSYYLRYYQIKQTSRGLFSELSSFSKRGGGSRSSAILQRSGRYFNFEGCMWCAGTVTTEHSNV